MSSLTQRILLGEFDGSSSDDEEIAMAQLIMTRQYRKFQRRRQQGGHVGSTSGQAWIPRDKVGADQRINADYFCENDATEAAGLSSIQKMIAALRMMAYGTPADSLDEYLKIEESTTVDSLRNFYSTVRT
ncbi:hypothetical protein RHMOL_Rhmol06G0191300 [Rhododendron molle]|uniref:Uncharacterized protein n=1 Tax=Rhododendron molle TaxID=49168 RepID=A0ACC0NG85_RHOML|nr:hypothetical protein RHMOL_Rhmol06G0191300 [Rhododendron molle]